MTDKYVLNDKREAVPCADLETWAVNAFNEDTRRVGQDVIGPYRISTVFLGLDHSFGKGAPMLFETMVFGLKGDEEDMDRCSTWVEAEAMHARFVEKYSAAGNA